MEPWFFKSEPGFVRAEDAQTSEVICNLLYLRVTASSSRCQSLVPLKRHCRPAPSGSLFRVAGTMLNKNLHARAQSQEGSMKSRAQAKRPT